MSSRDQRPDVLSRIDTGAATRQIPGDDPALDQLWSDEPAGTVGDVDWAPAPTTVAAMNAVPQWLDDDDDAAEVDATGDVRVPRARMAPPAAIALVVVGVLACVITIVTVVNSSDDSAPTAVAFPSKAGQSRESGASSTPAESPTPSVRPSGQPGSDVVVSVVGLVKTPGLVRLRPGARVADAVEHAGGGRTGADLLSLNMASPVSDGDQIVVGYADAHARMRSSVINGGGSDHPSAGSGSPPAAARGSTGAGAPVNLNTADQAALEALPGIGPVTAQSILAWRNTHGHFTSVDQLAEVDGIGPTRLEKLRAKVTV